MSQNLTLEEGKERFIAAWGTLGSSWGISRTMAQIHALLLISTEPLSAAEIRKELKISMGNANMNIRALIDWGLVYKKLQTGERKDYFRAEKDMNKVIKSVIEQRKKRELDPLLRVLEDLSAVESEEDGAVEFKKVIKDIQLFSNKTEKTLDRVVNADSDWLMSTFVKMMTR